MIRIKKNKEKKIEKKCTGTGFEPWSEKKKLKKKKCPRAGFEPWSPGLKENVMTTTPQVITLMMSSLFLYIQTIK